MYNGHILPPDYNRSKRDVNIALEVRANEHSLMCPTDRGNDPTVERDETERVDRERGTESYNRDGNGLLHFVFASLFALESFSKHRISSLKITAAGSSVTLFCTHNGTPVLAMHSNV
jgi:hypothetical protein